VTRLRKLFRSPARPARKARLGVEALGDRLVPSATFTEHPDHTLDVVAAAHQNNTITIRNDGDGNLRIVADGATRHFTHIEGVHVNAGDGTDTVTYNQGSATQAVNTRRSFGMTVNLADSFLDNSATNTFTANVFGDVGFFQQGTVHARELEFAVFGGAKADRIDFNFHDTDVRAGSTLRAFATGLGGNDNITLDSDGDVDGDFLLDLEGFDGNDTVAANVLLDDGSTGSVGGRSEAIVRGDVGDDTVRLAVRQQAGSHAEVNAVVDGGFNLFDHDVGRHTANVRTAFLEQDITVA
jgi:hypothetical protein